MLKPHRPCNYPRCPNLASDSSGYCDQHKKQAVKQYDSQRGNSNERGYGDIWPEIRKHKLTINPLCEHCEKQGLVVVATQVHHKDANVWNRSEDNLESLCASCHSKETNFGRHKVY